MARKSHQDHVEVQVEALEAPAPQTLASRLVLWGVMAAFCSLLLSWLGTVQP